MREFMKWYHVVGYLAGLLVAACVALVPYRVELLMIDGSSQ